MRLSDRDGNAIFSSSNYMDVARLIIETFNDYEITQGNKNSLCNFQFPHPKTLINMFCPDGVLEDDGGVLELDELIDFLKNEIERAKDIDFKLIEEYKDDDEPSLFLLTRAIDLFIYLEDISQPDGIYADNYRSAIEANSWRVNRANTIARQFAESLNDIHHMYVIYNELTSSGVYTKDALHLSTANSFINYIWNGIHGWQC